MTMFGVTYQVSFITFAVHLLLPASQFQCFRQQPNFQTYSVYALFPLDEKPHNTGKYLTPAVTKNVGKTKDSRLRGGVP